MALNQVFLLTYLFIYLILSTVDNNVALNTLIWTDLHMVLMTKSLTTVIFTSDYSDKMFRGTSIVTFRSQQL